MYKVCQNLEGRLGIGRFVAKQPPRKPRIQTVAYSASHSTAQNTLEEINEQLRAEVDARTKAMNNLQAQLDALEALRAEELKASQARFEELESALSLAESTVTATEAKAAEDLAASRALIEKAEELAAAVGKRLSMPAGPTSNSPLTEADIETLLDELDVLRDQLCAAEADAAALREQLAAVAASGGDGAKAMGGFGQAMVDEVAAARASAAEANAEAEGLRAQVMELREALDAARGGMGAHGDASVMKQRIIDLEEAAVEREAALAEVKGYLLGYSVLGNGREELQGTQTAN